MDAVSLEYCSNDGSLHMKQSSISTKLTVKSSKLANQSSIFGLHILEVIFNSEYLQSWINQYYVKIFSSKDKTLNLQPSWKYAGSPMMVLYYYCSKTISNDC